MFGTRWDSCVEGNEWIMLHTVPPEVAEGGAEAWMVKLLVSRLFTE